MMNPEFAKYIAVGIRSDIKREINSRGKKQIRKNENGNVEKKMIISASSSLFGWGVVNDTILNSKEILPAFKNLSLRIAEINYMEIEVPPPAPKKTKVALPISSAKPATTKIPPLIQQWYENCHQNLENGSIGLVPECYMNGGLPDNPDEWAETNVGQVVLNFLQFIKKQF